MGPMNTPRGLFEVAPREGGMEVAGVSGIGTQHSTVLVSRGDADNCVLSRWNLLYKTCSDYAERRGAGDFTARVC